MKILSSFIFISLLAAGVVFGAGLKISLVAETNKVEPGKTARVKLVLSQPVKAISLTDVSIDGGRVESLRKLNSKNYLIIARAAEDSKELEIQIQADILEDLQGDLNQEASNSVYIKIDNSKILKAQKDADAAKKKQEYELSISNLLNTVTNNAKSAQGQSSTASQVQYYNCNGQAIPTTQACQQNINYNQGNTLYVQDYSYYNPYVDSGSQTYVVYPAGLYTTYEISYYDRYYNSYGYYPKTYYSTYYNYYGYYPQSYYSSPYYEVGYGIGTGLRNLLDW